ncbi:prephenate dehydratase [Arthrospiribacter ruber]|uniref:prephenate dehydratase n=1 Tax=Arthrospiribacter ruber TaxID=2487934 RepID=A0A951MGT7_9BACT|nr:prephenate dehydratase [Arthrospiribacter ruber]MBW3469630.1 prephenate dehydratase [Arthrospiribacter ruber]
MKISIQGIPGSFHHQVALQYFGDDVEIQSFKTFEEVAKSVRTEDSQFGVMAIENSIAGAILPNYELIDRYSLHIFDEFFLPISHNLMCMPGQKIREIKVVRSHPMALLQCKKFFEGYPNISLIDDVDTATVAKRIMEEKLVGVGAIASSIAAEIYGLEILASDIQTVQNNFTRFILLQKEKSTPTSIPNKASIKVTISNERGSLAKLLSQISDLGLNLSKIQSIPVIENPWNYSFFLDIQFDIYEDYLKAVEAIIQSGGEVKVFGEYQSGK